MTKKLLGLRVTRTGTVKFGTGGTHTVWCGFAESERVAHREFIMEHCYSPEFDGEITFEHVEDDAIVTRAGRHHSTIGDVMIQGVRGVVWHGRLIKRGARGVERLDRIIHGYINGQSMHSGDKIITGIHEGELAA